MRFVLNGSLMAVLVSGLAWGQATSQIQGTVRDATGASVPAAEVKATQTDTGMSRTSTDQQFSTWKSACSGGVR